jgi:threonine dehydratase
MQKMLRSILTSKVYEAAIETPLDKAENLSSQYNNKIYLKREDLQTVFSFKIRGAYNKIASLNNDEKKKGIIAASAGNHAQGVALSAHKLNIKATIVMPVTTPVIKVDAVKKWGAEVVLFGDNYSEAAKHCEELISSCNMTYIHPFDDELVIAGQGTIGNEILRQIPRPPDYIFIPIGGGGLAAGVATYFKALAPEVKIIGVEPVDSDAMSQSIKKGRIVKLKTVGIFADGVAVTQVGKLTFKYCKKYLDDIVKVNTDEICSAIKSIYQNTRNIVEPAGALGVAGLKKYIEIYDIKNKTMVAINSGANMNFERLRYVSERTWIGEKKEALYAITIDEKPGSLKRFCRNVLRNRNMTEFNYRLSDNKQAHIFTGITIQDKQERYSFLEEVKINGYEVIDLTDNELAKTHIRYMVGGKSSVVKNEMIYRFWFPERPGAIAKFLEHMNEGWNISMFHYRAQGGDFGRILMGFEIPKKDIKKFKEFLDTLGYHYLEETNNKAYKLFL